MKTKPRFPGIRLTTNGNQLVSYHTEARITDAGVFYPITPSTEMGENYQLAWAEGKLNVFGGQKIAIEAEGEHAAQGGAIAASVTGRRVVNFTSGQGLIYGLEQYYHAPGKLSTMVVEVAARALTRHALNVHCGHDDIYAALDTGWIMLFAKDAQQAADQAIILRRVTELSLTPGINIQDGFLTSHLERTFYAAEAELLREFLGAPDDIIACPTEPQRQLFGPTRRRVPRLIDLENPMALGPVQNQEHYMNGVVARRNNFVEPILGMLEDSYRRFADLTGRQYGLVSTYRGDDADTLFVSLGSAAENIEAAVDYLREKRGAKVGSLHVNVLRPFPEAAVVQALKGRQRVIVLERTDEAMAGDNPLCRDIRTALMKAVEAGHLEVGKLPRVFNGAYGLGSRDFRPEGILGAFEFATGQTARQDGLGSHSGEHYFVVGVDHPYAVVSQDRPSLLPAEATAIRMHSIGGWGMITTGKNLSEILGEFGNAIAERDKLVDEWGRPREVLHISANPKYGSEKKGAPTAYFLVVAPERVRVNCDLRHVNVVLCCDPKAFTHSNPLEGLVEGGAFVWESHESPDVAWTRIPRKYRDEIIRKKIRLYTLPGFEIARAEASREDLELRMQGNAFLGAFFGVSGFTEHYGIDHDHFLEFVEKQYRKKFGRFGDAVVASNMRVMRAGMERVSPVPYGPVDAPDRSDMRGVVFKPLSEECGMSCVMPAAQHARIPLAQTATYDAEFRAGKGYFQPASVLASVGMLAAATGAGASKYVARRRTPVWNAEKCTQCLECIVVCPDTALPNTAQDLGDVLRTSVRQYVADAAGRESLLAKLKTLEDRVRAQMNAAVAAKQTTPFAQIVQRELEALEGLPAQARAELGAILGKVHFAYAKTPLIFSALEKKKAGEGGVFSIMVSDLCKGCGECVDACGEHMALEMRDETEELNADHATQVNFLRALPETRQKFLGMFDTEHPEESKPVALKNHLMVRRNYEAMVSGDGACAGCGEKSVLRGLASVTEAYMRPLFHAKARRLEQKAARLEQEGARRLNLLRERYPADYERFCRAFAHLVMGIGGENDQDTRQRQDQVGLPADADIIGGLCAVMRQDAFAHRDLQAVDGRISNGMAAMAMGAHTGCNTVFGSTPPNNPHPYPWMNSLFQDGVTVAWLFGESFIADHARRSIIPERLADALLEREIPVSEGDYFTLSHLTDASMSDQEIAELPKAWGVGGDGGMGDIGFQNVSKVVLQNRPNVKLIMLDTQVYSNTGGQNSDSSPIPGGFDMNSMGAATQGKLTEMKSVAEAFLGGHGSPYVAQVSLANASKFYKSLLEALVYRGTAYLQCYTPCQPEHGIADDLSATQAKLSRDGRGLPEFVYDPTRGESYPDSLDIAGNPAKDRDWWETKNRFTGKLYRLTTAHWAATEARFRRHFKQVKDAAGLVPLEEFLWRITQDDVVHRRFLVPGHRSFVPDFGVYIEVEDAEEKVKTLALSRQMVLFCVERRKAWRLLQSRAGVANLDYVAQKAVLSKVDKGEITLDAFLKRAGELVAAARPAPAKV